MENATIENMTFDREYLAVTVNVSATDRLVLYNRTTAEQWLASNPKYHVSDLSLDHGVLAWSVRDHFNPLAPQAKYLDREMGTVRIFSMAHGTKGLSRSPCKLDPKYAFY